MSSAERFSYLIHGETFGLSKSMMVCGGRYPQDTDTSDRFSSGGISSTVTEACAQFSIKQASGTTKNAFAEKRLELSNPKVDDWVDGYRIYEWK